MHKKPKNMHKIDYEKLISIKRDVGWFEKKEGDSIRGLAKAIYWCAEKKAQRRIGTVCSQLWNSNEQDHFCVTKFIKKQQHILLIPLLAGSQLESC